MWRLSNIIHNRIFSDTDESLCSRAWRLSSVSLFWRLWVYTFGINHCFNSWEYWNEGGKSSR